MNPREKDFLAKKEGDHHHHHPNSSKFPKITSSSTRQWSSHRNPRIVRVSRAFGGKDRHSKVCTVRGLRDRRIRLSVPTAIQLYDLQDRLGLSQPSKVVDWLIDATKNDIDKLPPLPMLPTEHFTQFEPQPCLSHNFLSSNPTKEGIMEKEKWICSENQEGFGGSFAAQNLFPLSNQSCNFPNMPYNSYFHWDPPSLSLSQFVGGYPYTNQTEDHNNNLPSASQLYFCPSTTIPSIIPTFPSYISTPSMDNQDWRSQANHLQHLQQNPLLPTTLHLITSPIKSFPFNNADSKYFHSQDKNETSS